MKLLTTREAAEVLQVNPGSVAKWIDQGLLRSYRTPGGHRRVARDHLVSFAVEQGMFLPDEFMPKRRGVLIADDEQYIVDVLCRKFRAESDLFDIATADDTISVLLEVGRHEPELILLDLCMPKLNGFELCRRLKEELGGSIKIIAITGQDDPDTVAEIEACGADASFMKPFDVDEVMTCARQLIGV